MCVSYMCLIHVGLVGFIPKLEVPANFQEAKNQQFLAARSYLVQQCVGAILVLIIGNWQCLFIMLVIGTQETMN